VWPVADSQPSVQVADSIVDGFGGGALVDPTGNKLVATRSLLRGDAAGVSDGGGNRTGDPKLDPAWHPAPDSPARGLATGGGAAGAYD